MSFKFDGGSIDDLVVFDSKSDSTWTTPMIISTLSFTISDSYPVIKFNNAHEIEKLEVSGSYCACTFDTVKIKEMEYDIMVGTLNINQNSVYEANKITVSTPFGTHCVAAETVNAALDADAECPDDDSRTTGFSSTTIDTTTMCTVSMFACSSSSCPSSGGTATDSQGSFEITQDDGPVQFTIDKSKTTSANTYNPFVDTFSVAAQATLSQNKEDYSSVENDPRMYVYEVVSPGYERIWVHSGLKQYIQARPWLLSILSLSILKPTYIRQTLIHIPDERCPGASPTNVEQNTMIREKLYELSFTKSYHLFALMYNDTYYEYELTSEGDFKQSEVPFLVGNIAVLLCVIFSCILAAYSIIMVFIVLLRLKNILERLMYNRLERSRKFAAAKRDIQQTGKSKQKKALSNKKNMKKVKVLYTGLFTSRIDYAQIVAPDADKKQKDGKVVQDHKRVRISFFQAPALYLDHLRRLRANSFKEFLNKIRESAPHFPNWKLEAHNGWRATSVRLDLLDAKYREFCTKGGYNPIEIEKQKDIIENYNLKIIYKMDAHTQAYTCLRWKNEKERQESAQSTTKDKFSAEDESSSAKNSAINFIDSECMKTSSEGDYILVNDLVMRYNKYCSDHKIDNLMRVNIIGCAELDNFGAKYNQSMMIPFMSGVTFARTFEIQDRDLIEGIVRIPKFGEARENKTTFMAKVRNRVKVFVFGETGIFTNLLVVVAHLLMLLVLPFALLLITIWSLQQIDLIDEDIYDPTYTLDNVFNPSYYEFWLSYLPLVALFWTLVGISAAFLLIGLIELISFYATGARDTGKYKVKNSWCKTISLIAFWIMLAVFIAFYAAYLSVILAWCIMGAIISPEKFLPMATGAGVFIVFTFSLYKRLKKINENLEEAVGRAVDEALRDIMEKTFGIKADSIEGGLKDAMQDTTAKIFHKSISMFLAKSHYPKVSIETTTAIMKGDMAGLINMMNEC